VVIFGDDWLMGFGGFAQTLKRGCGILQASASGPLNGFDEGMENPRPHFRFAQRLGFP